MEISGKIPPLDATACAKKSGQKVEKATAAASGADRVDLSDQARELQAARAAIQQMEDVDHEKVARIREQVQSGPTRWTPRRLPAKCWRRPCWAIWTNLRRFLIPLPIRVPPAACTPTQSPPGSAH
jgi:flagellar biosynthesis anti-sigma factor FlgM